MESFIAGGEIARGGGRRLVLKSVSGRAQRLGEVAVARDALVGIALDGL